MFVVALKVEQNVQTPELMSGDCPGVSLVAAIKIKSLPSSARAHSGEKPIQ